MELQTARNQPKKQRKCGTALSYNDGRRYLCITGSPACGGGQGCVLFMWATFPQIPDALKVMQAWGFEYKTAAFVWIKKYKSGGNFWGMGAYTRANAEVCLLGVTHGFKAKNFIKSHSVHQVIESPIQEHSVKPDETRRRIVELVGDVPRIELFARQRAPGWDAWGDEL